ncbi:glycosyltransferase family 2 protein [Candidatus Saccharibacteria bacterium]|nr:glycosyltransferase family 2 protein [Candidatus Saccharibacteria bacterium]MCB9820938.1 glycosyltransferase family 2 protein [Candidatus Nomurabacteria bacterium]
MKSNLAVKPKYSIVVPAYNEEDLLGDCLDSLLQQEVNFEFEIIVVDNNSSDSTASVAKKRKVRLISEKNPGVCWARQAGYIAANGKYIVSTDADTTFDSNWLCRLDKHIKTGVVGVGGGIYYNGDIGWANAWSRFLFGGSKLWSNLFGQPCYVSACNLVFLKSAIKGYDTRLTQGGDELAILKQLKKNGRVIIDPTILVNTSGRRQAKGLWYSIFVTFLWYYIMGYNISRLTRHNFFGSYPAFRKVKARKSIGFKGKYFPWIVILIVAFLIAYYAKSEISEDNIQNASLNIPAR